MERLKMRDGMRHSPCRENCAQVPRGPKVPVLGDGSTCPQRKTYIEACTAALPLTVLKWKGEHKRTIPERMDNKSWHIQTMKYYQAIGKNQLLTTPSNVDEPPDAKTSERSHAMCMLYNSISVRHKKRPD